MTNFDDYYSITSSKDFTKFFNALTPYLKKEFIKRNRFRWDPTTSNARGKLSTKKETLDRIKFKLDLKKGDITLRELSDIFNNEPLKFNYPIE